MAEPNSVWEKLRYFKAEGTNDNWGNPYAMDPNLLMVLDDFRHFIGLPILILQGNGAKHEAKKSFHYIKNGSCAVDIMIPDWKKDHMELLLDVFRFPFTGVGYYPHWQYNGKIVGGLHLDTRPLNWEPDFTLNYKHSRWLGVLAQSQDSDGKILTKQEYIPMTYQTIKTYGRKYGHIDGDLGLVSG